MKKEKQEKSLYKERIEKIHARKAHMDEFGSSFKGDKQRDLWRATFKTYGKRLIGDGMTATELLGILDIKISEQGYMEYDNIVDIQAILSTNREILTVERVQIE